MPTIKAYMTNILLGLKSKHQSKSGVTRMKNYCNTVAVLLLPLITILLKTRKKWKIGSNHSNNVTYENRME